MDAFGHRARLATVAPGALARLDYLGELLSKMSTHAGETTSTYDFTRLRPSTADIKEFGRPEAVLRLLNYQFHGQHVVDYCGDIMFRSHCGPSWIQLKDALEESISLAPANQLLREYVEELIAACQGELHEVHVNATLGASQAKEKHVETNRSYSESKGPSPLVPPAGAVKPDQTKAPRPKPRMKTKEPGSSSAKDCTVEQDQAHWMAANSHRHRAKDRASGAESSKAAKNRFDDPKPRPTSRNDIRPDFGLSPQLNAFYDDETSRESRLTKGVFSDYVVHTHPD